MNTTRTTHAQLESLRELSAARTQYEESLGWRVSVDVGHRRLVMPIGREMDAVIMPWRLADHALAELRFAMLVGPVAAAPGAQWLAFFTTPAPAPRPNLPVDLRQARVQLIPRGGQMIIPGALGVHQDTRLWRWVEAPRPRRALPPWCAVVAAARRAVCW